VQVTQSVEDPPLQVAQEASQLWQAAASEYLPAGQVSTQVVPSRSLGDVQVKQSLVVAAEQVAQELSQALQT